MSAVGVQRPAVPPSLRLPPRLTALQYLPALSLGDYLDHVAAVHPDTADRLTFTRGLDVLLSLCSRVTEFDSDDTGRGDTYRRAQRDSSVRWRGISQLLRWAAPQGGAATVLDVLGGDGLVARAVRDNPEHGLAGLRIITSDVSGPMVSAALDQGLAAVRQDARRLFVADGRLDAALMAYGSHHVPVADRPTAVRELARVVRPGGRVVLHDFEEGSPTARFFHDVVHPHALGGHAYAHFTRAGLRDLFLDAGLRPRLLDLYDPITVRAATPDLAIAGALGYIGDMYGVSGYLDSLPAADRWDLVVAAFDHGRVSGVRRAPAVHAFRGEYVAEVPRLAVVAVGQRPAGREGVSS